MRKTVTVVAVLVLVAAWSIGASAMPSLTGGFSKAGSMVAITCTGITDATCSQTGIVGSTAVDFNTTGTTPTPGLPGLFVVTSTSGSFSALIPPFATGSAKDFSFSGNTPSYPGTPIAGFETVPVGGVTFDLLTVVLNGQSCSGTGKAQTCSETLNGTGLFHVAGFADTPGSFIFTGNSAGGTFSFSASQAAIPEPAALSVLGLGLWGLGWFSRRRTKA